MLSIFSSNLLRCRQRVLQMWFDIFTFSYCMLSWEMYRGLHTRSNGEQNAMEISGKILLESARAYPLAVLNRRAPPRVRSER